MWADNATLYQIYPLGFCGAPRENDGVTVNRIARVTEWIPYLCRLGVGGVCFSPLFSSETHGYDTRDFFSLDPRLGTNADFAAVCRALHGAGLRVVLDGVFNHVGRGFAPFRDVLEHKWESRYRDWFYLNFGGDTPYHDGLHYECWEGHYELVKLNLGNPEVRAYLFDAVKNWITEYGIDGLRLDVAYCLDRGFTEELCRFTRGLKADFWLMGEVLFGDYNLLVRDGGLDSCTNYENYKSLYSAVNSENLYELSYSLNRQFGYEPWCIYRGKHLVTFLDNHDVGRIASVLKDPALLPVAFGLQFTTPGIPTVYYGSEWGITGNKADGDNALRPETVTPCPNALTEEVCALIAMRRQYPVFTDGGYRNLSEGNTRLLFERASGDSRAVVGVNLSDTVQTVEHAALHGAFRSLPQGQCLTLSGSITLPPKSITILLAQTEGA